MKMFAVLLTTALIAVPLRAQFSSGGLQDGGHGSGGTEKAEYTITANPGWNIISVPVQVPDFQATTLFPTALSPVYRYQGGYSTVDTLENGEGYWVKFPAAQVFSLNGSVINTDTVPVAAGWNVVGSISSPVPAASVTPVGTVLLGSFFLFENGYVPAATIEPGKGYWIKTSSAGVLVLASGTIPLVGPTAAEEYLSTLNSLTLVDAAGNRQRLYFGAEADNTAYELPPAPPTGVFDVRFGSGHLVAGTSEDLRIASVVYPVTVEWNIAAPGAYTLVVNEKEIPMTTGGTWALTAPSSRIALRMGAGPDLPTEFGLVQNYPNPFNPSTEIGFAIPAGSRPQVLLQVFDVLGRKVATLVNEVKEPGRYTVQWGGANLASGMYYYRLEAGSFTATRKMLLLK